MGREGQPAGSSAVNGGADVAAEMAEMRILERAAVRRRVRAIGLAATYAAVALLATAFFFFLHDLGNRLPPDLAQQRFKAEFEAGRPDEGQARGYKTDYEYCEMSETVLAGAGGGWRSRRVREGRAWFDAVVLSTFASVPGEDYCHELEAALNGGEVGDEIPPGYIRSRYWWGGKALYAIALRYLSVREFREFTLAATRAAYLVLAVSLLLLAPRTLPAAAPLLAFGAFSSGVEYWADVANGLPYLWAVSSSAVLVWLMRARPSPGVFSGAAPVYCFAAGGVSSFLWLGDGHTFLAVTWIGLLVWSGHDALRAAERTRRAASCMALYGAGFLSCYGLGLAVKADIRGYEATWLDLWGRGFDVFDRAVDEVSAGLTALLSDYHDSFYAMAWPSWLPAGVYPTTAAVSALAVAVGFAVHRARRGRVDPLRGVLWIAGLMAINAVSLVMPEDIHYRGARFVFVPLALCWSGLVLSVRAAGWRLSSAVFGVVLVVAGAVSSYSIRADGREIDALIAGVEDLRPVVASRFDVYLDGNRLVYVNEECGDEDVAAWFFMHVFPADPADLPDHRERYGWDGVDFAFGRSGFRAGGRCAAVRALPEYELASVSTGQSMIGQEPEWSGIVRWAVDGSVSVADPRTFDELVASVEGLQPVVASRFDVYLDGDTLVYMKEECGDEDVDALFFLHLFAADDADLPDDLRAYGFENFDFAFRDLGRRGERGCAVARVLPEYEIASIHTGQYIPGVDPEWSGRVGIADARAVDELIAGVEGARPVVAGGFDVYLEEDRLVYVKEECGAADVDAAFFLHLYPADAADLPDSREPYGFDDFDFTLDTHGHRFGGRCAAARALPEYGIASIRTGRYGSGPEPAWSGRVGLSAPGSVAAADARAIDELLADLGDRQPVISGGFDVHLDGNRLVYVKEECGAADVDALFFLHFYPIDTADLPERSEPHGFDNFDFAFERYGLRGGGRCAAVRGLPEYEIASVHTGQYTPGRDPEWSGRVSLSVLRTAGAAADSRAIDDLLASVEDARPAFAGGFDVHVDGNRLVYVKEECGAADVDALFFLHLYPVDEADLPEPRKPHGFDNLDFTFERYGLRGGGRCAAVRVLPEYELARIDTGQYRPGQEPAWSGSVGFPVSWAFAPARAIDALIAGVEDARPVVAGGFDVYLDGDRLVYVKEECGAGDVDAEFFLHLYPVDEAALPDPRKPHGFDNLDFAFGAHGRRSGGRCAAVRILPEYELASVRTGRYAPGQDPAWSGSFSFPVPWSFATARAVDELIAGVEEARPLVAGVFDVHLDGDRLAYVKEECGAGDVDAGFFLHLYPVDEADLPDPRKPHGFDNLDFAFEAHGRRSGGRCAAVRILPGYGIASIRTGQYVPGQDPEWSESASLETYAP